MPQYCRGTPEFPAAGPARGETGFLLDTTCAGAQGGVAPVLYGRPFAAGGIPLSVPFSNGRASGNPPFADLAQWMCRAQRGILRIK